MGIVDDDAPFAVQNLPAGRENRHISNAVFFRSRRVVAALHHLQPPQSIRQHKKNGEDRVLRRGQADCRYFSRGTKHRARASAFGPQARDEPRTLEADALILSGEYL